MSNTLEHDAVEKIFAERKDFIIIGLTGRTGCGCSTVAKLLEKNFEELEAPIPNGNNVDDRQYRIVYNYAKESWSPFRIIEMKHVIFTFILENRFEETLKFINTISDLNKELTPLEKEYNDLYNKRIGYQRTVNELNITGDNVPGDDNIFNFYFCQIPEFYQKFQNAIPVNIYTKLMQIIGDNIRASGQAFFREIQPANILKLSQRVNMLIKILRRRNIQQNGRVLIVIDAFRNPYEATFFKDRYSSFYLFSVNTDNKQRRDRLVKKGMDINAINNLDEKEYPSRNNTISDFYQIDIEKTIELAEVHISNFDSERKDFNETKKQLVRYISLIMHPSLVTPTPIERCMQIAYDSKLNSGCISRQVGAVITDSDFNILSNGWNTAPLNQIPCNLRSLNSIIKDSDNDDLGLSKFEKTNIEYKDFLKEKTKCINFSLLKGRICSYCFKDAYNAFKKQRNQVYTRSIHAEEMAFLQSAKYNSPKVTNGFLFTTASPCELCSKKACQTGISKIYYIDQYPGISFEHILSCGERQPQMILFNGAIGRAYNQFYSQVLPYKDELYMLLSLTFKDKKGNG